LTVGAIVCGGLAGGMGVGVGVGVARGLSLPGAEACGIARRGVNATTAKTTVRIEIFTSVASYFEPLNVPRAVT